MIVTLLLSPAAASAQSADELVESGHVQIRAWVEPTSVLVGQRAVLRVQVMTRTWYLEAPSFPTTLEVEDAVVLRPDAFAANSRERLDGHSYAAQTRSYAVFPVAAGTLQIPAVEVGLVVARDDASRSDTIVLKTAPLQLGVSIPEAARGRGLVVATPRLAVSQEWSGELQQARVGDAITRTITQTVSDSVAMVLQQPPSAAPEGISAYAQRPELNTDSNRGRLSGRRVDRVTYVLEEEGRFELPEVELVWWDLGNDRLQTELLPGLGFEVAKNLELAAEHLGAPVDDGAATAEASREPLPWDRILMIGALLVLLLIALPRAWKRLAARFLPPNADAEQERQAWREFLRCSRGGDQSATFAAMMRWLDTVQPGRGWREVLAEAPPSTRKAVEKLEGVVFAGSEISSPGTSLTKQLAPVRREVLGQRPSPRRSSAPGLEEINPRGGITNTNHFNYNTDSR